MSGRWPWKATAALGLAVVLWAGAGLQRVPAGATAVRDSAWLRLEPALLRPGWHWTAPGFTRVRQFPPGPIRVPFAVGTAGELRTREGGSWALAGVLTWEIPRQGALNLARASAGPPVEKVVLPALREAAARAVAAPSGPPGADAEGARALQADLAPRLAAAGIRVVSLQLTGAGAPGAVAPPPAAQRAARKVLLVGWDGADWAVLDPLLDAGEMPHLKSLLAGGIRARLRTVTPVLSPVIWTSVATGATPLRHGIVDFLASDPVTGARIPVTSNLRRVPALWNLVSAGGMDVDVVAWWATWPAESIQGAMVTDRIAYQLFGMGELPETSSGKTWPPGLYDDLMPLIRKPDDVTLEEVRAFATLPDDPLDLPADEASRLQDFRTVLAATGTYDSIARHLMEEGQADFTAVYYEASDTAAHLFMPFVPPLMSGIDPAAAGRWGGVLNAVYRDLDRRLGELLARTDRENTAVVVLSDHGFRSGSARPRTDSRIGGGRAGDWHRKYGVLVMAGAGVGSGTLDEASVLDVAPTVLALMGLPVPGDMDGTVLAAALQPGVWNGRRMEGTSLQAGVATAPVASPDDGAIKERLRSLGYIGADDVDSLAQDEVTAFNNRATILLGEGDVDGALAELEKGLALAPAAVSLRLNKARALRSRGDEEVALALLLAVLADDPSHPAVENIVANIYMDRGDLDSARTHLDQALALDPNFVDAQVSAGLLAERQGNPAAALAWYRKAAATDPQTPHAPNNIGNLHRSRALEALARGQEDQARSAFADAETAYRQALEADPDFIGTYNNLALILQETGRPDAAMALYRQALERSPENAIVHNNLGSLYFAGGRLEEARQAFSRAIEAEPGYESAHNNLGAVYGRLGRLEEELAAYRQAVALAPDYADGHHNLGLALLRRGETQAGETALLRALDLNPDSISAAATLGEVYLRQGRLDEAVSMLKKALAAGPGRYRLHNLLGEAHRNAGHHEAARAEWQRSLELVPGQPEIRRLLEGPPGG